MSLWLSAIVVAAFMVTAYATSKALDKLDRIIALLERLQPPRD